MSGKRKGKDNHTRPGRVFDFDEYGGEPHALSAPKALSWRDDPASSMSDHVIRILEEGAVTATYHVHRCQLGAGKTACEYFRTLLSSRDGSQFSERSEGASQIELVPAAAAAFPSFLDFVYGEPLEATSKSAVPLLHLANYFGNQALYTAVADFMQQDLTGATSPMYLVQAESFRFGKVVATAIQVCAESFAAVDGDELLVVGPSLFAKVMQSDKLSCPSKRLSLEVAHYCLAHSSEVDGAFLEAVTCPEKMPSIDPNAALGLLKLALLHSESETQKHVNSLRKRCIEVLATDASLVSSISRDKDPDKPAAKRPRAAAPLPFGDSNLPPEVELEIMVEAFRKAEKRAAAEAEKRRTAEKKCAEAEKKFAEAEKKCAETEKKLVVLNRFHGPVGVDE